MPVCSPFEMPVVSLAPGTGSVLGCMVSMVFFYRAMLCTALLVVQQHPGSPRQLAAVLLTNESHVSSMYPVSALLLMTARRRHPDPSS